MKETIKFLNEKARRLEELAKESSELSQNIQAVFEKMLSGGLEEQIDHDCKLDVLGTGHCDHPSHKEHGK